MGFLLGDLVFPPFSHLNEHGDTEHKRGIESCEIAQKGFRWFPLETDEKNKQKAKTYLKKTFTGKFIPFGMFSG